MRQTYALLAPRVLPLCARSLQVAASPLLGTGPSRRYSANLSQRVWTHTPAASKVHLLVSSLGALAFPTNELGRRLAFPQQALQLGRCFRGCSHSLMFRPIALLATPVAPTLAPTVPGSRGFYCRAYHGWLPAPCSGYANRPNPSNWR
jgi:hypothetical protein